MLERPQHSVCALTKLIVTSIAINCQVFYPCLLFNPATLIPPLDTCELLRQRPKDSRGTAFSFISNPVTYSIYSHATFQKNINNRLFDFFFFLVYATKKGRTGHMSKSSLSYLIANTHPYLFIYSTLFLIVLSLLSSSRPLNTHTDLSLTKHFTPKG